MSCRDSRPAWRRSLCSAASRRESRPSAFRSGPRASSTPSPTCSRISTSPNSAGGGVRPALGGSKIRPLVETLSEGLAALTGLTSDRSIRDRACLLLGHVEFGAVDHTVADGPDGSDVHDGLGLVGDAAGPGVVEHDDTLAGIDHALDFDPIFRPVLESVKPR